MLDIVCHLCEWKDNFCTSKTISKNESKRGRKAYEVNTRTCIDFREIGRGYDCIRTFCRLMNIPPPPPPSCNQMFISQYTVYYMIRTHMWHQILCKRHIRRGKRYNGKLLSGKKKFSGTGRCTNKVMNTLQNYYGMTFQCWKFVWDEKRDSSYRISLVGILS